MSDRRFKPIALKKWRAEMARRARHNEIHNSKVREVIADILARQNRTNTGERQCRL
jgi:hypothetical protein